MRSERQKRIIELRAKGLTAREIAKELGISHNNMMATLGYMRKLGYIPKISKEEMVARQKISRNRNANRPDPQKVLELYQSGLSRVAIAAKLKQSEDYIRSVLNAQLPSRQLKVDRIILFYNRGLSYKSIAKIINVSPNVVAITMTRLLKKGVLQKRRNSPPEREKIVRQETTEGFTVFPLAEEQEPLPVKPKRIYKRKPYKPMREIRKELNIKERKYDRQRASSTPNDCPGDCQS